jgi:hypothetical protein
MDQEVQKIRIDQALGGSKFLRLDLDDFYIHGRILMDRLADLIAYLIDGPARSYRKMSFQQHRKFFLKNVPYEEDETYAEQVRKHTNWFDAVLRTTRDIFVVHDTTTRSSGILFGPRGAPQTFRQGISSGENLERMREKLYDLRSRYAVLVPLMSDERNFYELLDLFDKHTDILKKEDLILLSQIKATIGAKIPDVNILADDILAFIRFAGEHFSKKFGQTSFSKLGKGSRRIT